MSSLILPPLKPVTTVSVPCKICGGSAALYGVVDFNKSCEEARGHRLQLSGVPIYYRRCVTCSFLFTDAFDDWSNDEFKAHIYNDSYHTVDPDYGITRARARMPITWRSSGRRIRQKRAFSTSAAAMTCFAARFAPTAFQWRLHTTPWCRSTRGVPMKRSTW